MELEEIEWLMFGCAPIMAIFVAMMVYNAIRSSRRKEQLLERDMRFGNEYRTWRENVKNDGGINHTFCPMSLEGGERCFAFEDAVAFYEPASTGILYRRDLGAETECGADVEPGWSVTDCFDEVRFIGNGRLLVSDRRVCFSGTGLRRAIPLEDVRSVAAACSGVILETRSKDRPMLFNGINGQRVRDTILILMRTGEDGN
ncbi:MAG: hypothetical protein J6T01_06480 [Kiritimatiellae bacterium]|nr:hypothetical protein [Kiritimatiellia bacterium]